EQSRTMANLISIKRRIKTAQNVSKTTKAMQMIAASKLKRAEDAALSSRPYVEKLTILSRSISKKVDPFNLNEYMVLPKETSENLMIVIAPDKGLCGGLVTNLARQLLIFYRENKHTSFVTVGKKANGIIRFFGGENIASFDFGTTLPSYDAVYPLMSLVDDYFLGKKAQKVYILNSNFNSVFSQTPTVHNLLPVAFEEEENKTGQTLFEPSADELIPGLIRHYLEMRLYQSLLETYLSEQAARMLAMQNATDNAKDIIEELRLLYNKTRQEKITNEILDIAGGMYVTT
ncbi:MAG: ATP synthase F1 subunit gamma, partial [Candidatus Levybacteria bacterium]|nr:ATP synthase F1 subunit gamma [Candidatus Levybacteria bacterium]